MKVSAEDFATVAAHVRERAGIVLEEGKEYLVETRLAGLCRAEGHEDIAGLVRALRRDRGGALSTLIVEALTTNETSFFRDRRVYDALQEHVLPDIIERNRSSRKIKIWSAACSTGQEPYTLGIVLRELLPDVDRWNILIDATDIDRQVIERAREARFSRLEVNRGVPAKLLVKYFVREQREFILSEDVKRMVQFRLLNLIEPWRAAHVYDLIMLRNVLIYFDRDVKRRILERVSQTMNESSYLVLGGAETTMNVHDGFVRERVGEATVYRHSDPLAKTA